MEESTDKLTYRLTYFPITPGFTEDERKLTHEDIVGRENAIRRFIELDDGCTPVTITTLHWFEEDK